MTIEGAELPGGLTLRIGGLTDTGLVRASNQDAFSVTDTSAVVADGMGGHAGGEVASQLAVEAFGAAFSSGDDLEAMVAAVENANLAVLERADAESELRGMGTTLCAVARLASGDLGVVNVGDSRVYVLRQGELTQLSDDHSVVAELVRDGRLTEEEAAVHPHRNRLTRAIGIEPGIGADHWTITPVAGLRILLCSDGLVNEVPDAAIASALRRLADPDEAAAELVRLANAGGGRDNTTVVIVDVVGEDEAARAASAALADEPPSAGQPAPAVPADDGGPHPEPDGGEAERAPGRALGRRPSGRAVALAAAVIVVLGAALGVTTWVARGTYFVGFDGDTVAIYQGRPGGLLWYDPTLSERTTLTRDEVPQADLADLESGHEVGSLDAARRFVDNLTARALEQARFADPSASSSTTTTTAP